jgi:hypothetical protein
MIPAADCTGHNKAVKSRQLWGDGSYTDDSDLVAALMHGGYYAAATSAVPQSVASLHAVVELAAPRAAYPSSLANGVRSRAWMAQGEGCSFKIESAFIATRSGHMVDLTAAGGDGALVAPTFAPSAGSRHNTRSTVGSRNRPSAEVTLLYNLANEPWLKYTMASVADQGLGSDHWTSARLRGATLYLETARERLELRRVEGEEAQQQEGQPPQVGAAGRPGGWGRVRCRVPCVHGWTAPTREAEPTNRIQPTNSSAISPRPAPAPTGGPLPAGALQVGAAPVDDAAAGGAAAAGGGRGAGDGRRVGRVQGGSRRRRRWFSTLNYSHCI